MEAAAEGAGTSLCLIDESTMKEIFAVVVAGVGPGRGGESGSECATSVSGAQRVLFI